MNAPEPIAPIIDSFRNSEHLNSTRVRVYFHYVAAAAAAAPQHDLSFTMKTNSRELTERSPPLVVVCLARICGMHVVHVSNGALLNAHVSTLS